MSCEEHARQLIQPCLWDRIEQNLVCVSTQEFFGPGSSLWGLT